MVFRKKIPNAKRTFKIPFGWIIPILAVLISLFILSKTDVQNLFWGLIALVIEVPFYFVYRHQLKKKTEA